MFGKKPKKQKNQTKEFIDGVEQVPDKVPDLEVPKPPEEKSQKVTPQEIYDEGRSVGFQEGMVHAMKIIGANLEEHQAMLKKKYGN